MVGSEFRLLLLAVDHHDGVGVQMTILSRLDQVLVAFEQDWIADCDASEYSGSVAVHSPDEPSCVLVVQFHQIHAGKCAFAAQLVGVGHHSRIEVRAVWPEWHSTAGYTWARLLPRLRSSPGGPVVFAEGLWRG